MDDVAAAKERFDESEDRWQVSSTVPSGDKEPQRPAHSSLRSDLDTHVGRLYLRRVADEWPQLPCLLMAGSGQTTSSPCGPMLRRRPWISDFQANTVL